MTFRSRGMWFGAMNRDIIRKLNVKGRQQWSGNCIYLFILETASAILDLEQQLWLHKHIRRFMKTKPTMCWLQRDWLNGRTRFIPYCTISYHTVIYCIVSYGIELYCTVLYCTVLYCMVSCCIALYCTALCHNCILFYCTASYYSRTYNILI